MRNLFPGKMFVNFQNRFQNTTLRYLSLWFFFFFFPSLMFTEKGQQYLSSAEEDSDQADPMKRPRRTYCSVITRINNASHTIGKDGKVRLLFRV